MLMLVLVKVMTRALIVHASAAITIEVSSFTKAAFSIAKIAILDSNPFTVARTTVVWT